MEEFYSLASDYQNRLRAGKKPKKQIKKKT